MQAPELLYKKPVASMPENSLKRDSNRGVFL